MPKQPQENKLEPNNALTPVEWELVQRAVKSIQYGVVQLIIQDGKIIQIDKTEKTRLRNGSQELP